MPSIKDQLGDSLYAERYPHSPGYQNRSTSKAAAEKVTDSAKAHADILARLRVVPSTADEVSEHIGRSILYTRPRVAELAAQGKIVETGLKRANPTSGRKAIVWKVTL